MACNFAGSRRFKVGSIRDHILGFRGVNGKGDIIKSGGTVVKNVTGYDLIISPLPFTPLKPKM